MPTPQVRQAPPVFASNQEMPAGMRRRPSLLSGVSGPRACVRAVLFSGIALLGCCLLLSPALAHSNPIATAAKSKSCRSVSVAGTHLHVTIERGRVNCQRARQVFRTFFSGKGQMHGPPGGPAYLQTWTVGKWTCGYGAGGGGCTRDGSNSTNSRDYILAEDY
jgi:hypothetical protein